MGSRDAIVVPNAQDGVVISFPLEQSRISQPCIRGFGFGVGIRHCWLYVVRTRRLSAWTLSAG